MYELTLMLSKWRAVETTASHDEKYVFKRLCFHCPHYNRKTASSNVSTSKCVFKKLSFRWQKCHLSVDGRAKHINVDKVCLLIPLSSRNKTHARGSVRNSKVKAEGLRKSGECHFTHFWNTKNLTKPPKHLFLKTEDPFISLIEKSEHCHLQKSLKML